MNYRLRDVIERVDHEELVRMKKDLESGGIHLRKLVEEKIKENERMHDVSCTTCQNRLDPFSTNNYTLLFGPNDFQKKASFCAIDCLEYFIQYLKNMKKEFPPENKL